MFIMKLREAYILGILFIIQLKNYCHVKLPKQYKDEDI